MNVGWIRVSDKEQAGEDRFGIPRQRTKIIEKAKAVGVSIEGSNWCWKQVEDVCGAHVMAAPETIEVVGLAERGELESIFVSEVSRLARPDKFEAFQFMDALQNARCIVHTPEKSYDLTNRSDILQFSLMLAFAGYERGQIHDRTVGSKDEARNAGRYLGGRRLAFGMNYDRKLGWSYDYESGKAQKVREAFERIYGGEIKFTQLVKEFGMTRSHLDYILKNPIYTGFVESRWKMPDDWMKSGKYGKSHSARRNKQIRREKPIHVRAFGLENTEPLVSPELFNAVQKITAVRVESRRRERGGGWAIYQGFVFCDYCGALLTPEHYRKADIRYYRCISKRYKRSCNAPYFSLRADGLEAHIDDLLMRQLTSRLFLTQLAMLMGNDDRSSRYRERAIQIEAELRGIGKKRLNFQDMRAGGELTKAELAEHLEKLSGRQTELEGELLKCHEAIMPTFDTDQLTQMFEQFAGWDTLTRDERRSLLTVTIPRLRIRDGRVVAFYRLMDGANVQMPSNEGITSIVDKKSSSRRLCRRSRIDMPEKPLQAGSVFS